MSYFATRGLSLALRQFRLREVSLALDRGQTLVLLGPSGSGKSVLLETIAGFHRPAAGRIELAGRDLGGLPPEERGLGFMFQDYALFPHLTVEQNVAFGVRHHRDARPRTARALDLVGALHLARRRPATLSGGEKQRVALARALMIEPRLFLFDEPLSALDAVTRERLRGELRGLLRSLGATSVYVTHDRVEALMLGDVIAVMRDGVIRQVAAPEALLARPADAWVAAFLGMQVLNPEACEPGPPGRALARVGRGVVEAIATDGIALDEALLVFRPEDVRLERLNGAAPSVEGAIPAVVESVVGLEFFYRVELDGSARFSAVLARQDQRRLALAPGDKVLARFASEALRLVPPAPRSDRGG
jgi:molybdate transport system ATP-binding protein